MIHRRKITADIEQKILTGIIISNSYAKQIIPMLKKEYFDSETSGQMFEWVKDFFIQYKEAPGKQIEEIFKENKNDLDDDRQELIQASINSIKDKYEEKFNVDYLVDQSTEYIKAKSAKITAEKVLQFLESNKVEKAEQELQSHRKIAKLTSGGVNPFDPEFIRNTLYSDEFREDDIFIFPGALGKMSGWLERDWLVAVVAPMKRGKSFFLMEMAIQCILNERKVVFFSLEMSEKRMGKRILRRIAAYGKVTGDYLYPCFDCKNNQDGTCRLSNRTNRIKLLDGEGNKPPFTKDMKYKPCTSCRGKDIFKVATWYTVKKRNQVNVGRVMRKAKSITKMFGDNFRLKSYPANSANTVDLKAYLDSLEYTEGFVPDAIFIDYADILKTEDSRLIDTRTRSDETWKMMKNLADSRHCLVVTATQGTRKSIDKKSVGQTDISEDIRKLAHIDMMYSLNQTPNEKKENVMRIGVIGHRDEDFNEFSHVIVLQQRAVGQVILDSELIKDKFSSDYDLSILE